MYTVLERQRGIELALGLLKPAQAHGDFRQGGQRPLPFRLLAAGNTWRPWYKIARKVSASGNGVPERSQGGSAASA